MDSAWLPARRVAIVAGLAGIAAIDAVIGHRWFVRTRTTLTADAAVIAAVALAMVDPRRLRELAAIGAAAASVAVSWRVDRQEITESTEWAPIVGFGAWPGFAEFVGIGLLAAWSLRNAHPVGAGAAWLGSGAALAALVKWRELGTADEPFTLIGVTAWFAVGIAGLYLRHLDRSRLEHARQARQEERITIARELHDLVAHHVTGIVVQAQAAKLIAGERPAAAGRALDTIERAGADALAAMRQMVGALRDEPAAPELAPTATVDDLRALADPPRRGEVPVRVAIDERAAAIPGAVIASVHRIAREAVTNARRHAVGATTIDVRVMCADGVVHLRVENDGVPGGRIGSGFGLRGMAERAAAIGGRFTAGPLPHGGWQVAADLPVAAR